MAGRHAAGADAGRSRGVGRIGVIHTMERHHELLRLWRRQEVDSLRIAHLDFHCDMRGMLVDQRGNRAFRIRDRFPDLDQGNFLTHAVLEGRVESIRWVHDDPGGRAHDIGTVKLMSDITALPYRVGLARRKGEVLPLEYEVIKTGDWHGLEPGEHLDIDWDYFAAKEYDPESIAVRIDRFLTDQAAVVPEVTYVCYSPEYSHPSRDRFDAFVAELASRFGAEVVAHASSSGSERPNRRAVQRYVPDSAYHAAKDSYRRAIKSIKRWGIY